MKPTSLLSICAIALCLTLGNVWSASVTLYDTGSPIKLTDTLSSLNESSWNALGKEAVGKAIQGDAVLINKKIAAVIRKDGSGVELYAKGTNGWNRRGRIGPVLGGALKKLSNLKVALVTTKGERIGVDASIVDGAGAGLVFTIDQPGFPAVKATPRGNVQAIRFQAPCRLGILPDFWTDDLMIDARTIPIDKMEIPAGNIFLHPVGSGHAILAAVWEKNTRDIEVKLSGKGKLRTINSSDIFVETGGSVWAAILEQENIWYETPFTAAMKEATKRGLKLDWKVPFIAKWKANTSLKDGTVISRQFIFGKRWHDGLVDILTMDNKVLTAKLAQKWDSILKNNSIDKSDKGSTTGEHSVLAAYPISRDQDTPLTQYCIDDLLRLLDTEKCSYVLDLDARKGESVPGSEKGIFTCSESVIMKNIMPTAFPRNDRALAQFIKDERVYRRLINDEVLLFLTMVQDRINSYVAFRKDLLVYLKDVEKEQPELSDFIKRLRKQITKPTPLYNSSLDSMLLANGAEEAQPLLNRRIKAMEVDTPENAAASLGNFRHIGDPQDGRVQSERLKVARLRVMATMEMAVNPKASKLAKEIRKRVQGILRNPTTWEKPKKW